jgi:phosphohistidine phosphatase SixA
MGVTRALWWTLRLGAAFCFIGHGAFGIITKEAWLPFFRLVGIGPETAFALMPVIGVVDIAVGLSVLVTPRPAALLYMVAWAFWTAALRPLTGDSVFELLDRAANYGVPFAMLLMCLPRGGWRSWLAPATPPPLTPALHRSLRVTLLATTALLILGHGGLSIRGTPSLTSHYASLGLSPDDVARAMPLVGWLEIGLILLVVRPSVTTALAIVGWKLATESLWLVSGAPVWEFIERAGSYAAPLGLAFVIAMQKQRAAPSRLPLFGRVAAILLMSAAVLAPTGALAQEQDARPWQERIKPLDDRSLLAALRAGGLVLACRHGITPDGVSDESETDRARQRNLSEEGRQQAIAIGRAVRAARVGICPVFSSPMYRTRETAELAFGDTAVVVTRLLRGNQPHGELMQLVLAAPPEGQNKVLMTHQGTLYRVLTMFRRPEIRERDCVVLRPNFAAGTFEVVGKLGLEDWERLAKLR